MAVLAAAVVLGATVGARQQTRATASGSAAYPYGSKEFAELVSDSYAVAGEGSPEQFHQWLRDAYRSAHHPVPRTEGKELDRDLASKRTALARVSDARKRTQEEKRLAEWAHRFIKKAIPRFSLERGFEFSSVVKYGERQCLLQSVLIAGLLQAEGCSAGVVMVYKSDKGQFSNNGHVTVLLKLPNGTALLVDASDPTPFVKHQGLLVKAPDYRYVSPVYKPRSTAIARFRTADTGSALAVAKVSGLDTAFVRSQFWYYRGERAPGGVIASTRTAAGLATSRKYLEKSVGACPGNALAVYMLGRTLLYQGDTEGARKRLATAEQFYSRYGWVPEGLNDALEAAARSLPTEPRR